MTKLTVIGDVHGKWDSYARILKRLNPERSIQIGDFGWGFQPDHVGNRPANHPQSKNERRVEAVMAQGDHKYFRGNHDNTDLCAVHQYCLPDVYYEDDTDMMIVAGANSIDKQWRVEGDTWWADEELTYDQLSDAIDEYDQNRPSLMLTHECPESIVGQLFPWYRKEYPSRTREALDSMLAIHQPDIWIFGHWHTSIDQVIGGTRFICLNELETTEIEV